MRTNAAGTRKHQEGGEAVKAAITPGPGAGPLDGPEVIAWYCTRIAAAKCPRSVDVLDALPPGGLGQAHEAQSSPAGKAASGASDRLQAPSRLRRGPRRP